jgi:uncharacterized protein YbjT (DUF2867 family)
MTHHTRRIAVTTPTGHVGSRVIRLLLQAGVRPTLLLRDPSRLDREFSGHVEIRKGDLGDADFVVAATREVDSIFWVDPTNYAAPDPNAESARLGGNLAAAVTTNRIAHTVFQSSVGAEKRHGAGLIDGLAHIEEQLDATGTNVLHLRCGYFFTNLLDSLDSLRGGVLSTAMAPEATMPWVDPRDIGDIVAARLLAADWSGRLVQAVHGPADLTWPEVASILSAACGRPIELAVVSDEDLDATLLSAGMNNAAAAGIVGMTSGLRDDFRPEQPRSVLTTTPTTLGAWAYAELCPQLASAEVR